MNWKEISFWVMLVMIIGLSIYVLNWTKSEGFECLDNPYTYSIKLLEKSNSAKVDCVCTVYKTPSISVLLDRDGFHELERFQLNYPEINISQLEGG